MKSIVQITYSAPGVREVKRFDSEPIGTPTHSTKDVNGDMVHFYTTSDKSEFESLIKKASGQ
jgi:hypothetical protein